jgi:hypothetical protein
MPICLAILSPCTKASYSATLFDARKCICSMYCSADDCYSCDGVEQTSLCVVNDQPVGNPKRKV